VVQAAPAAWAACTKTRETVCRKASGRPGAFFVLRSNKKTGEPVQESRVPIRFNQFDGPAPDGSPQLLDLATIQSFIALCKIVVLGG
jgi:hypothetical protein